MIGTRKMCILQEPIKTLVSSRNSSRISYFLRLSLNMTCYSYSHRNCSHPVCIKERNIYEDTERKWKHGFPVADWLRVSSLRKSWHVRATAVRSDETFNQSATRTSFVLVSFAPWYRRDVLSRVFSRVSLVFSRDSRVFSRDSRVFSRDLRVFSRDSRVFSQEFTRVKNAKIYANKDAS